MSKICTNFLTDFALSKSNVQSAYWLLTWKPYLGNSQFENIFSSRQIWKITYNNINTSYLTDTYIFFTLEMESVSKNTIFDLKTMVKSGLEKIFLKSLHVGDYFLGVSSSSQGSQRGLLLLTETVFSCLMSFP